MVWVLSSCYVRITMHQPCRGGLLSSRTPSPSLRRFPLSSCLSRASHRVPAHPHPGPASLGVAPSHVSHQRPVIWGGGFRAAGGMQVIPCPALTSVLHDWTPTSASAAGALILMQAHYCNITSTDACLMQVLDITGTCASRTCPAAGRQPGSSSPRCPDTTWPRWQQP
jgi:hypothetical protein